MHAACSETIKSPGHGFLLQHQFDSSTSSFVAISAFFPSSAARTERMFTTTLLDAQSPCSILVVLCVLCFSAFTDSLASLFFHIFDEIALFLFDDYDYAWDGEPEIFTLNLF